MVESFHSSDLRVVLTHLAQTNYATQLTKAQLDAGVSFRPSDPVMPDISRAIVGADGARAFTGNEWARRQDQREMFRDVRIPLNFRSATSYLVGWAAAFALGLVTSVQEGVTGHYTHTIRPIDPLASGNNRQGQVTSMYFEALGPDAGRRKAIFPSLAVLTMALTIRPGDFISLALELIGSGKEDITTVIVIPALTSEVELSGSNVLVEIGNQGAGLSDFTARLRELTISVAQVLDEARGYTPNAATPADGKFRSRIAFLRRTAALTMAFDADRANTDLKDRALNQVRSEVKVTVDSGVLAGSGTDNHGFEFRVPDCRLRELTTEFDESGAFYRTGVTENDMYPDSAMGNVPFQLVVENEQASYLV